MEKQQHYEEEEISEFEYMNLEGGKRWEVVKQAYLGKKTINVIESEEIGRKAFQNMDGGPREPEKKEKKISKFE